MPCRRIDLEGIPRECIWGHIGRHETMRRAKRECIATRGCTTQVKVSTRALTGHK
jgi:hypothetical protein